MIRSSVLDEVVTRLDSTGAKTGTIVNVDAMLTAVQSSINGSNSIVWTHIDPLGLSEAGDTKPVYDALGNSVQWQHVPTAPPNAYPPFSPSFGGLGPSFGYAINSSCTLDGRPTDCRLVWNNLDHGSAVLCPKNDCGPQPLIINNQGDGTDPMKGWAIFTGSGFWLTDGESSEHLFFDDLVETTVLEGMAYSLTSGKSKKKKSTKPATVRPAIQVVDFMTLINQFFKIEHFTPDRESWIRYEMKNLLTLKCSQAFPNGVNSPTGTILERGVVIRPAEDLQHYSAAQLGLSEATYLDSNNKVFRAGVQGGTVFGLDGRAQIYLNDTAFWGPNLVGTRSSLGDVLRHEFIHAGGQGPWPATAFGKRRHDLAGFPAYKNIMKACR